MTSSVYWDRRQKPSCYMMWKVIDHNRPNDIGIIFQIHSSLLSHVIRQLLKSSSYRISTLQQKYFTSNDLAFFNNVPVHTKAESDYTAFRRSIEKNANHPHAHIFIKNNIHCEWAFVPKYGLCICSRWCHKIRYDLDQLYSKHKYLN